MKRIAFLFISALATLVAGAQTEVTSTEAKTLYKTTTKQRVSVHDPSVVYEPSTGRHYIFGSHKAGAYTTDMQNWTQANPTWKTSTNTNAANNLAFVTPAVKTVKKGGVDVAFPQFNAMEWSARTDAAYNIDGNMWAPDVIWNPTMNKWCMYLSINGEAWHSSIILLTADNIRGPYLYQGPVVICGFSDATHTYKDTDLELVLGTQTSLPTRYARTSNTNGQKWGDRWPHTIDPAAFYDEDGKLWLVYGSWSGGIWMLELNEENGLRDYDVTYPSVGGNANTVTSDPYFGKKIAGGLYVSGEGPYIEHIGNYYYLFVSYGFYSPDGGYEMRVFRSEKPDGPYKDALNRTAIFSQWVQNYGLGTDNRGEKLMGAYNGWGFQTLGECAQGHNSIIAAADGRTYLVYHTKFNNGSAGHQVRTHQVFQNKNGWLVAAPFEYNGETVDDQQIATTQPFTREEIAGTYKLLVHKYKMDYANMEEVTPVDITLNTDGTITGSQNGTWSIEEGTGYITLKLGSVTYNGVVFEETMDSRSLHTVSITAMATTGVNIWAYKLHPKYALAWQLNNQKVPVSQNQTVSRDVDLYAMELVADNVTLTWSSSLPEVISDYGKYNPKGLTEDTPVTLTARLETSGYFWQQAYNVKAQSEAKSTPAADWHSGLVAHYGFDGMTENSYDATQEAKLLRNGTTPVPTLEDGDPMRMGSVVHLSFGANSKESYVQMPNPLKGQPLEDGATLSFWVKRTDDNLWDALYAFTTAGTVGGDLQSPTLFMTGNTYTAYNDGAGNWLDINQPDKRKTSNIGVGHWHLVTVVFQRKATASTGGITVYIDGTATKSDVYNGSVDGKTVSTRAAFDYNRIVDHLSASSDLFLGRGSFWGSPDARFDDVLVYNRPLIITEVLALRTMSNRVFDFASLRNDVNGDGHTDIADVLCILNAMAHGEEGAAPARADINGDKKVDYHDVVALMNIIAKD